jgi:hypothetical protein
MGRVTDQDVARAGGLLKPRRDIYGIAGHQVVLTCARTGENLSTIHTDANLNPHATLVLQLAIQFLDFLLNLDGGAESPKCIVFVHGWYAKHGHHGIPNELLDRPTVTPQHVRDSLEVAKHQLTQWLWIETRPEPRRLGHVDEDDRHGLTERMRHSPSVSLPAATNQKGLYGGPRAKED